MNPDNGHYKKKEPYIGSVRFFKNLILLAVIIMIAVPSIVSISLKGDLNDLKHNYDELSSKYDEASKYDNQWCEWEATSPYQDLYPDFYAPHSLVESTYESGVIYLTFDDGPSDRTVEVLDILKEKNAKATFFVVGNEIKGNEAILKRMVDEGHTVAMHTGSHSYVDIYESVEAYLADMYYVYSEIEEVTGVAPSVFRFPGGSINNYNSGIYQELVAEMLRRGFVPFDWNISSQDASIGGPLPASTIATNIVSGAENVDRGVVLMHDSNSKRTTVEALAPVIDELYAMGFELKAITPDVKSVLFAYHD